MDRTDARGEVEVMADHEVRGCKITANRYTEGYFFRQEMATCKAGLPRKWKEGEVAINVDGGCVLVRLTPARGKKVITYAYPVAELLRGAVDMEG